MDENKVPVTFLKDVNTIDLQPECIFLQDSALEFNKRKKGLESGGPLDNTVGVYEDIRLNNIMDICRTCFTEKEPLLNIYEVFLEDNLSLKTVYQQLTEIIINKEERISTKICNNCRKRLEDFWEFKKQARTVQEKLSNRSKEIFNGKLEPISNNKQECNQKEDEVEEDKKFSCSNCSSSFESEQLLKKHKKENKVCSSGLCDICGKIFIQINRHVQLHGNDRPFQCKVCGNRFKQKQVLAEHMYRHNKKEFQCPDCDLKFHRPLQLEYHQRRIHKDDRPFACTHCEKRYLHSNMLEDHMRRAHQGVRHECKICSSAFTSMSHLKRHLNLHTKLKPYKCNQCSKAFAVLDYLRIHANRIHPEHVKSILDKNNFKSIKT